MKLIFLFNIFFFLLFISDKDKSIFCIENLSEEKVYVKNESLQINQESAQNSFRLDSLNNNINSIKLYVDLSFNINENKYDLINFELVGEEGEVSITFYRLENEFLSNKTKLELKLSDIVSSDNNYLIITRLKKKVEKEITINLSYKLLNYSNKKRIRNDDEFNLYLNSSSDDNQLIYECGFLKNQKIIFTVLGTGLNNFYFKYKKESEDIFSMNKSFYNGYSIIIDENICTDYNSVLTFIWNDQIGYSQELVKIKTRTFKNNIELKSNDHFDLLLSDKINNECFIIPKNDNNGGYIFNFITYTKNIIATFTNTEDISNNDINEIEWTSYYNLDSNKYNQVCFKKNKDDYDATLSFDFLEKTNNSYYKSLIRGLPKKSFVSSDMISYYKPEVYYGVSKKEINFKILRGNPSLYISKCTDSNDCSIEKKLQDINGFISYIYEIEEIYAMVQCPKENDKGCEFLIEMKDAEEKSQLLQNIIYNSFLDKTSTDKYAISKSQDNYELLVINIYCLFTSPNVEVYDGDNILNNEKISLSNNIFSYSYDISEIELQNILVQINSPNIEIYYGINYELRNSRNPKNISLQVGTSNIFDLNQIINSDVNFIINKDYKIENDMIISINTFTNSNLKLIAKDDFEQKNNLIKIETNESLYSFKIQIKEEEINEPYINIYAYLKGSNSKILMQEGYQYTDKLTEGNDKITYSLLFVNGEFNEDMKYILNFRKFSDIKAIISIGNDNYDIYQFTKMIFITKNHFDCTLQNFCELAIKIQKDVINENKDLVFSIQLINSYQADSEKIYLPQNIFMNGILQINKIVKYYGTCKEDICSIYVDFFEGRGKAFISVNSGIEVNKTYEIDYYNKKFDLSEYKCSTNICKFEIDLYLDQELPNESSYKYNIYLKTKTSSELYFQFPAYENIYGFLQEGDNEHYYITENILDKYKFELDCDFCEIKNVYNIGNEIKFVIKLKEGEKSYYRFKINFYKGDIYINHLNSNNNNYYCQINSKNPCYYLVYKEEYNYIENLQFIVQNNENVIIYSKIFEINTKEEDIYSKIVNNEIIYDIDTSELTTKNYLECKKQDINEYILLLKITSNCENNMNINLVHRIFDTQFSTDNIYKEDYNIINSDAQLNLDNTNNNEYYILNLNILKGTGKIEVEIGENNNEIKRYTLMPGFLDNINIFSSPDKNYSININNIENSNSVVYYKKLKNSINSNIKEIIFGKSNYFTYKNPNDNTYLSFYINLEDVNIINNDIHLNYKFIENELQEKIDIEIYLVDKIYILNEKAGSNVNIPDSRINSLTTYYKKDLGAGYALLFLDEIKNIISKNPEKTFLYIKINHDFKNEFDFSITLTDFSSDYPMPINEYLFLLIKDKIQLNINKNNDLNNDYIPYIEAYFDKNLIFNNNELERKEQNGKTIFTLVKDEKYTLTITSMDSSIEIPNLLIKYSFSNNKDFSYFELNDNNINYDINSQILSFNQITKKGNNELLSSSEFSVNYNIYIYQKQISKYLVNDEIPLKTIKIDNSQNTEVNISSYLNDEIGTFYINILAEARIKGENIYEYILYNEHEIENGMKVINITNTDFGEEKIYNIPKALFKASIELEDNDNENFRFVVLNITDNNHNLYDDSKKKEIYVSTNENLFNSENPYEYSEYKTVDYHQQIILTIPLEDIINTRKIYILIPCNNNNNICDYTFNFMVEDGKKLEGISIHDNSCFDIKLSALNPNEYYRFVYTIVDLDKSKHPLITFTSSSVNDFTILNAGLENEYLKRSFHNGYAFLFEYDQGYYEYHTFVLNTDYTSIFQICHRTIQKDDTTKIFVGQQVYSMIRNNFEVFMPDCFSIIKKEGENDYSSYILSIITITRNIDLIVYENDEKNTTNKTVINEEFFSTNLNKDIKKFCLNQSGDYNGVTNSYIYSSIYFQILGVENGKKVQYTNAPLINGLSVEQTLEKDEILYYRLNDYLEGSNQINIYLKKLEGEINLYKYICENIFNYSFDSKDFSVTNQINFTDNNYINRMDGINNTENIYHKLSVPVYVVHCLETETNCKFIIELSNEKNYRLLIKNNRREINTDAYQGKNKENNEYNINGNEGNEFIFKTIYYAANLAGQYYNYYLEFHVLQGNVSNICVNGKMLDNGQIFERKFFYYINVTEDKKDFCSHVIKGTIEKGTNFYVNYRVLNLNDGNSETSRFFLPEKEMHYSLLVPNEQYLSYYFTENLESNDSYIVTMTGINSHFTSSEDERQIPEDRKKMGKYKQFIVNARDSIHFICMVYLDNEGNCLCESVVSASKLSKDSIIDKFVEFDGFYQYYNLDGKIKQINHYYSISKSGDEYKLIDDKSKFLVIVNKNSLENLTINYGINHTNFYIKNETKILYKLNEIFEVDLKELIKNEENQNIDNEFNTTINLFLTISSSYDMEIKIKTNMKNQFTYLDCDGTEIGYLNKGEALYYYFDYKFVNYYYHKQWNSWNIQGVYLANKGNVKIQAVVLENIPEQHTDMSDIDFSNTSLKYNSSYLNHFKIYNDGQTDSEGKCQKGCRFCFKVFLDEEDENNDNGRNLFTIYRFNQDLAFTVQLNENIYGFMYEANYEEYSYQIYVKNLGVNCLKLTFNCRYCTLSIYKQREDKEFITNGIIYKEEIYERFLDEYGYIQFFLSGSESGYFFFSISDPNKPKYIEQLETERCYNKSCKFIFPLHDYYNYTKNRIILFVPDYKRIKIYYEMANMNKYENDYIPNFELDKKQKYKAEFRNYLIIDIDEKEKYLYIHATTEEDSENDFDFIMNQFLNSPNTEDIEFTKNIVDVYDTKEDFLRLKDDGFYEIDLYLINGNGTISIDHQNKIKYDYYLNYEYQESIKILIRYENIKNFKIQAKNLDDNNNFTFFINATLIDDDDDRNRFRQKLDSSKVYRFKYFKDNIFNPNLFPLKFQIPKIINKEVFINYRFIELKGAKTNAKKNQDYNIKDEIFKIEINNFQNINYNNIYYPEFMRGFFSMKINEQFEKDKNEYIDLDLELKTEPLFPYDEVLLEINVLYIGNKDEEIIYLPKNAYIELALNANQSFNLVFSEYNSDYQKMYIELSNIFENNSTGEGESRLNCSKEINGKIVCNPEEQSEIYIMKIPQNSTGNILVKYTTIKNTVSSYPYFALNNNSIDFLDKKDDNNTFELTIHNIEKKLTGYLDFNLSYFIRLYSYLDFYNDIDVENILTKPTDMQSYKLDINNSKFLDKTIKHNISFGKLETKMYYISVIASVSYNDTVEYFAFKPHKFKIKASNEMSFEKNWVAPLVILIFLFIIIVSYIVYKIIESIKNKKSIQRRVTTDILINKANLENKD